MSEPIEIAVVVGTRPEAIKLAPLILAARERPREFRVRLLRTGQHRELVDRVLDDFDLRADLDLGVMAVDQRPAHVLAASLAGLSRELASRRPHWVVVQGDTVSTLAGALAGFYARIPVGHVEAGLRTGDLDDPFPEECQRVLTSHLTRLHCAPTARARGNLLREGVDERRIVVTGNTVVDALRRRRSHSAAARPAARYVVVTTHRRENRGARLHAICDAVVQLVERSRDVEVRVVAHPTPGVHDVLVERLRGHARIALCEPLDHLPFIALLEGAAFVLTDSGGVQEECTAIGKPVLVLREATERPEAVEAGVARVVGTDPERIVEVAGRLLDDPEELAAMAHTSDSFGDGHASTRILDAVALASRASAP